MAKTLQTSFIQNLMNKSYVKKLHHLTPYQAMIVDDLTSEDLLDQKLDDKVSSCECLYNMCKGAG